MAGVVEQVCGPLPWRILDSETQSISLSILRISPEYVSSGISLQFVGGKTCP